MDPERDRDLRGNRARLEPWPLALAAGLASMIGVCVAFWWIAVTHPDAEVTGARARPGLQQAGATHGGER